MKDKISIIVPCYNVQKYVMRCFGSIYNQTYGFENLEVIFVDDLSEDNTWPILESLQKRYPGNVISLKAKNKGRCGGARNLGMDVCSGKYITFVDADDCIHPQMLEAMWNRMQDKEYDIIQCRVKEFSAQKPDYESIDVEKMQWEDFLLEAEGCRNDWIIKLTGDFNVCVWAKLYRMDFIRNNHIRFVENTFYEDNHFSFVCILVAEKICVTESALLYYYVNTEGITKSSISFDKIRDLIKNTDAICDEIKQRNIKDTIDCEAEIFIIWKSYFETWAKLENVVESEKTYYKNHILDIYPKEKILGNPYIESVQDEKMLEALEFLKR